MIPYDGSGTTRRDQLTAANSPRPFRRKGQLESSHRNLNQKTNVGVQYTITIKKRQIVKVLNKFY